MTRSLCPDAIWASREADIRSRGLERRMRCLSGPTGSIVATPEGEKLNFCSNDYLGLADNKVIRESMIEAVCRFGNGAGASRLVCGNQAPHHRLEERMADYLGTEAAVGFVSGYQANVGALSALTGETDAVFSDALVHASLIDGARLSRADVHVFRHGDMAHLESLLEANYGYELKLIVTDSLFSMDGDLARLEEITRLAEAHGALIYLDEAHALGVLGPGGRGVAASLSLGEKVAVRIGTFSKAFGVCGAFVALPKAAASLLTSRARSLLYTTAPPALLAEAAMASLDIVESGDHLRQKLQQNITCYRALVEAAGLPVIPSTTPIQPIVIGQAERTMAFSQALWDRGLFVQGIRPPTVPEGTSRLRIALTAKHEEAHIIELVTALAEILAEAREA